MQTYIQKKKFKISLQKASFVKPFLANTANNSKKVTAISQNKTETIIIHF
jgi:hypothetical protein